MSTKQPTGMFPTTAQLRSGDVSYPIKNKGVITEHWNGCDVITTDPVIGDKSAGKDLNAAIVEKNAEDLAQQYAGVYKPSF